VYKVYVECKGVQGVCKGVCKGVQGVCKGVQPTLGQRGIPPCIITTTIYKIQI
jgi:hypothetical protein